MKTSDDNTEEIRRARLIAINTAVTADNPNTERQRLEAQHGQVWDAAQLSDQFEALAFLTQSEAVCPIPIRLRHSARRSRQHETEKRKTSGVFW